MQDPGKDNEKRKNRYQIVKDGVDISVVNSTTDDDLNNSTNL